MKNKVLIIIYVPIINEEFELYIPTVKKIGTIKNNIIKMIEKETEGSFKNDGCKYLYDKSTGDKLQDNVFVRNSVIKNGSKLILD